VNLLPPRRNGYRREYAFKTLLFAPLTGKLTVILRFAANLVQVGSKLTSQRRGDSPYLPLLAMNARTWSRKIIKESQSTRSRRTFECGLLATLRLEAGRHRKDAHEMLVPIVAGLKVTVAMCCRGYAR